MNGIWRTMQMQDHLVLELLGPLGAAGVAKDLEFLPGSYRDQPVRRSQISSTVFAKVIGLKGFGITSTTPSCL